MADLGQRREKRAGKGKAVKREMGDEVLIPLKGGQQRLSCGRCIASSRSAVIRHLPRFSLQPAASPSPLWRTEQGDRDRRTSSCMRLKHLPSRGTEAKQPQQGRTPGKNPPQPPRGARRTWCPTFAACRCLHKAWSPGHKQRSVGFPMGLGPCQGHGPWFGVLQWRHFLVVAHRLVILIGFAADITSLFPFQAHGRMVESP